MTCRDFQIKWDELLDADPCGLLDAVDCIPSPRSLGLGATVSGHLAEETLQQHEKACASCRQFASRYRLLRRATRSWRQIPLPSPDLTDRMLTELEVCSKSDPRIDPSPHNRPWIASFPIRSIAASVLFAVLIFPYLKGALSRIGRRVSQPSIAKLAPGLHPSVSSQSEEPVGERIGLNRALAEATTATWDLARFTSEPAARISREVLDATAQVDPAQNGSPPEPRLTTEDHTQMIGIGFNVTVPSLPPFSPEAFDPSAALLQVGDRVAAGVRPLSESARYAFGFLIGPSPNQAVPRTNSPSSKGA